jgi:hypothetical protein
MNDKRPKYGGYFADEPEPYMPPEVMAHRAQCDECKLTNSKPMCDVGSAMLSMWLMDSLKNMWEEAKRRAEEIQSFGA